MLDTTVAEGTGGGISLKIRDLPYYAAAHGIIQAEYFERLDGRLYYDLSFVDCSKLDDPTDHRYCPFASGGVWMYSSVPPSQEHGLDCLPAHCTLFSDKCKLPQSNGRDEPKTSRRILHVMSIEHLADSTSS
jgi:hypothetical protein